MALRRALSVVLLVLATSACDRATPKSTIYGTPLSDRVVHLASGDSVQWQATLPVTIADAPPAVLIEFYSFTSLDSTGLRRVATEFLPVVVGELPPPVPDVVILRAVNLPTDERVGLYTLATFGVVFERRKDRKWYVLHEATPVL